jgi:hypothetical protein
MEEYMVLTENGKIVLTVGMMESLALSLPVEKILRTFTHQEILFMKKTMLDVFSGSDRTMMKALAKLSKALETFKVKI